MVVLLTCLICPLVETFDTWDHTIQTGNDTEYPLVLLALCVGVAYSMARFVFKPTPLGLVAKSVFAFCAQKSFLSVPCGFTRDGLPIGLQLIGRAFDEATLLRIAFAYERANDWRARHPHLMK